MNDNMSAMMDGVGKIPSIDTIFVTLTHLTNRELSKLKDSILVFNNGMITKYVLHHKSMESGHSRSYLIINSFRSMIVPFKSVQVLNRNCYDKIIKCNIQAIDFIHYM